ncbi:MAG TPA: acyltransferase [Amnibacterium sp.]|jgi:peptidoglycan/LPS O-acetylase OafA/YrhL|nr:acyltransferase [Amnibacterium sp.]
MTAQPTRPIPAADLGYNPVLDGLRALAVTAVIAEHAGFGGQGFHGVTVFFVISGYLITSLLIRECDRTGTVLLRRFYWRRFIRLGPALLLAVLATVLFLVVTGRPVEQYWAGPVGALTYSMDLVQAVLGNSAVGIHFQWSWSLGIEEQFYLLWPFGLLLLWRGRRHLIAPLLLALVAGAWVLRAAQNAVGSTHESVFFGPLSHYDALVLGVLIAVFRAQYTIGRIGRIVFAVVGAIGAAGLVLLEFHRLAIPGAAVVDPDGFGQAAVFSSAVVLWASVGGRGLAARLLGSPPLAFLGKLSYGLYLWNMLTVQVFIGLTGHRPAEIHKGVLWAVALLAVCVLSYLFVEQPLRRRWASPAFLETRPRTEPAKRPAIDIAQRAEAT